MVLKEFQLDIDRYHNGYCLTTCVFISYKQISGNDYNLPELSVSRLFVAKTLTVHVLHFFLTCNLKIRVINQLE